jgi:cysteine desulfurase
MADIYFDHNATSPLVPEVLETMLPHLQSTHGNPSCAHSQGRAARAAIEDARAQIAAFLGCAADEVVFTSGGTEANNLAIKGAAIAREERGKHLLVGGAEHPSVSSAARFLERFGWEVEAIPVDETGQVQPAELAKRLRPDTTLVSIMTAQNVVGTINRMDELAEVLRGRGVLLHTDAAQAVGKIPAAFPFLGADLMTLASHKFYGPKGVGALIVKRGVELEPLLQGAGHEGGRRAGTENTAGIVGMAAAIDLARRTMAETGERVVALRDALHLRLATGLSGVLLNGHPLDRLPNTLNLSFLGVSGKAIAERVPHVLLATGPACHDRADALSPTFKAMGLGPERGGSSLRISLGRSNTWPEIEAAAETLIEAVLALRSEAGEPELAQTPSTPPVCPRCHAPLRIAEIQTAPAVVCERHPECRHEVFLAAPVGAL